ncbi:hypothetical protein F2Q69_00012926 [Brassica cretica]|uniref:Uncharacterized protein n=1 Tax=Brassica cretica TaxID=69181 RepID=A0A8S9QXP9_BRACR|nr:hypothetical protein F2Q69_00012926 [Brassica cretica]
MTTNDDKDPQTHDGTPVDANTDKTPTGNISTVTADTAILDQMKEMSKALCGTTRARSGKRLDFETPGNRAAHADKASSGQNPDETLQPGAQPTMENLPPPTESNEGEEIERIDLDISDQSDHSDDGADIHPRRTRGQSARQDASSERPVTEEEENLYWATDFIVMEEEMKILSQKYNPQKTPTTTVLPVGSPASSAVTRASSPGENDRVAGRLAGELDHGTDQLARLARPILRGPFRTRSHPITMHLRPKFP